MQDQEFKRLLLETCPVRPGQERRAWSALHDQMGAREGRAGWRALFYPAWRGGALAAAAVVVLVVAGSFFRGEPVGVVTAESQSPGIYATAYYSRPAQAQVVWLNGMDPATDKLTYQDPTMVISATTKAAPRTADPNSL